MEKGKIVEFDRKKYFKYIKPLGSGGTGDTHLFEDETTSTFFAFKKYSPKDTEYIEELYSRFIDEIKILFKISHPNIVRIYNYYLYPELTLGYLQMEYIEGYQIDQYTDLLSKSWNDIFFEAILAFEYLENNKILHRDIRPANILIDKNENVKIIDFGFGKALNEDIQKGSSIYLNWPVSELSDEIKSMQGYSHKTEMYFIGKLFKKIVKGESNFIHNHIINKMIMEDPDDRFDSFGEISKEISSGILNQINFCNEDKSIYIKFVNELSSVIAKFKNKYAPINDLNIVLNKLNELLLNNCLEIYLPNNCSIIDCFIDDGSYSYYKPQPDSYYASYCIEIQSIKNFYEFLLKLNKEKQKIVLDNIYNRLSIIEIEYEEDFFSIENEELPF